MVLGLSTSWNASGCRKADKLIFEIKAIGFKAIELSFNLAFSMVKDIARMVKEGRIRVLSLHNFCPIPPGLKPEAALPDYYSLASLDENQRQKALYYTKRTIDTAQQLGARAVVLHSGRVEIPDRTKELIGIYTSGRKNSAEFIRLKNTMIRQRQAYVKPHLEKALRSLDELNQYALKRNVCLGIENRIYYREIPSFEEIGLILNKFRQAGTAKRKAGIFYWHDTGHAQVMENLGFARHKDYLSLYAKYLLGIHLHDINGCRDHEPPPEGELDFKQFRPYLKKGVLKIIEVHQPATAGDLKKTKDFLEKTLDRTI